MHCDCGTNNRAPRWTFTDPCKPEVRPGAREEWTSPAWLAAPAMNARDTTKVYIKRLDTGCGPTLYRKCHSHNTPGKRHNNTWVEPLAGNCTTVNDTINIDTTKRFEFLIIFAQTFTILPQNGKFWNYSAWRHNWIPFHNMMDICLVINYSCAKWHTNASTNMDTTKIFQFHAIFEQNFTILPHN